MQWRKIYLPWPLEPVRSISSTDSDEIGKMECAYNETTTMLSYIIYNENSLGSSILSIKQLVDIMNFFELFFEERIFHERNFQSMTIHFYLYISVYKFLSFNATKKIMFGEF